MYSEDNIGETVRSCLLNCESLRVASQDRPIMIVRFLKYPEGAVSRRRTFRVPSWLRNNFRHLIVIQIGHFDSGIHRYLTKRGVGFILQLGRILPQFREYGGSDDFSTPLRQICVPQHLICL